MMMMMIMINITIRGNHCLWPLGGRGPCPSHTPCSERVLLYCPGLGWWYSHGILQLPRSSISSSPMPLLPATSSTLHSTPHTHQSPCRRHPPHGFSRPPAQRHRGPWHQASSCLSNYSSYNLPYVSTCAIVSIYHTVNSTEWMNGTE